MTSYTKDELVPFSELSRNFGKFLNSLRKHRRNRIAIIRNDRPEAVVVPIEEYERLEQLGELLENIEIGNILRERETKPTEEYLDHAEMKRRFGIE
jgi:prevent-host-death family protein